jgi:hypothetical protein
MRRTLGLALALPTTLVLLGGAASPSAGVPVEGSAAVAVTVTSPAVPSTAATDPSVAVEQSTAPLPDIAPPAGEVGDAEQQVELAADGSGTAEPERSGEGFLVAAVPAIGGVAGSGPRWRYTVEVDPATGLDPDDVARQVRAALHDPRSWARERTLEQVADPSRARIRVLVATPETVDTLCARAGLRTVGIYSCWNGRFAALNGWRWEVGARGFADITTYRTYLINHEVGHGFGYGHVGCPEVGAPAPVMMQQSKHLDGCVANGWPYPSP